MRSDKGRLSVLTVAVLVCSAPALGGPVYDVEVRLLPTTTPAATDELDGGDQHFTSRWNAVLQRYVEPVDWTSNPNYALEVWISDNNGAHTPNTGVISAYFNVFWDNGAINNDLGVNHSPLFNLFPSDPLENFGGSDATFAGQGSEPTFARVGWIDFALTGAGVVNLDAVVGLGEIGVLNRTVGDVQIIGAAVPEPASLLLLGLGALICRSRRRSTPSR